MNSVILIGRLTKDPEVRYNGEKAVARFTIAVDRVGKKDEADFIGIVCFGKTAELVEKYVKKGKQIAVNGRINTGSYEKDGKKVYTTDIIADRVEFLGTAGNGNNNTQASAPTEEVSADIPAGFTALDEDIPF